MEAEVKGGLETTLAFLFIGILELALTLRLKAYTLANAGLVSWYVTKLVPYVLVTSSLIMP